MKKTAVFSILIILSLITLPNVYATGNNTEIDDAGYLNNAGNISKDYIINDSSDAVEDYNTIDENLNYGNLNPNMLNSLAYQYYISSLSQTDNQDDNLSENNDKNTDYPANDTYNNTIPVDILFEIIEEDYWRNTNKYCGGDLSIIQKDLVKIYGDDTRFKSTFYGKDDERMKNETIHFKVNGITYSRKTNEYGQAFININLPPGNYTITSFNMELNTNKTSKITVLPNMDKNKDIIKYYRNDTQYTIRLLDSSGNPTPDKKVTFNINGVFYERISNSTGYAKLNINLHPGTYIITAEYENCKLSNNITVLPVLSAYDISMKYLDNTQFTANLIDGQRKSLARENVTFNINGVFYQRTTDNQGIARLNIRLMPGKYIITSTFNGTSISNTINIAETERE